MKAIRTFRDFERKASAKESLRNGLRKAALRVLALRANPGAGNDWIRFPYYHHVFEDERKGFERQLKYFRRFGDFLSMDEAINMLTGSEPVQGRYFCVSFDDGFENCYHHMMPITAALNVPVMIYLPTDYIGLKADVPEEAKRIARFYPDDPKLVPFLSWEQCREMMSQGVSFGSHTCSHANLSRIPEAEIRSELERSKARIEEMLQTECRHFACPWGRPGIDFKAEVTEPITKSAGYASFATTARGPMRRGGNPFMLHRDHVLANWENYQLKYFFGK